MSKIRIAYFSDIHTEFWDRYVLDCPDDHFKISSAMSVPKNIDADIILIGGDTNPNSTIRDNIYKTIEDTTGLPVLSVLGNHDIYGSSWEDNWGIDTMEVQGFKIGMGTLWTRLTHIDELFTRYLSDFRVIKGITVDKWNRENAHTIDRLQKLKPDIIMTHHAPFSGSIADRWVGDNCTPFFVNYHIRPEWYPDCKLWIHGHVHDGFDYMADHIHVVCNPHGYPSENTISGIIVPKIIEVEK